jgi:hypothetical protein
MLVEQMYTIATEELHTLVEQGDVRCLQLIGCILGDNKGKNGVAAYLTRMQRSTEWGGEIELGCVTATFGLPVVLYLQTEQEFELSTQYNGAHSSDQSPMPFLLCREGLHYTVHADDVAGGTATAATAAAAGTATVTADDSDSSSAERSSVNDAELSADAYIYSCCGRRC